MDEAVARLELQGALLAVVAEVLQERREQPGVSISADPSAKFDPLTAGLLRHAYQLELPALEDLHLQLSRALLQELDRALASGRLENAMPRRKRHAPS